jgi:hypothetical protein
MYLEISFCNFFVLKIDYAKIWNIFLAIYMQKCLRKHNKYQNFGNFGKSTRNPLLSEIMREILLVFFNR